MKASSSLVDPKRKLEEELFQPHRHYIKEDTLMVFIDKSCAKKKLINKKAEPERCFLFSDMFVIATPKTNRFVISEVVKDVQAVVLLDNVPFFKENQTIALTLHTLQMHIYLTFETQIERKTWQIALQKVFKDSQ